VTKLLVLFLALSAAGCRNDTTPTGEAVSQPVAALPAGMSRVTDTSLVCMVNDQFMGNPQIPIAVQGRTYYGCCPMCKERLGKEPATRIARDPVTGQDVDKATAVIIKDAAGKVLYFASEDTLRRYRG
jgi:YHS domain-containing protein